MKKNVVKMNESTLRQIVAECVKKVLNEGMLGAAMRNAYNSGRYDDDKGGSITNDLGDYIKGDKDADRDSYKTYKGWYKDAKNYYKQNPVSNPNAKNGVGGFSNWTNKATAQYDMGLNGLNAMYNMPGIGGKLARTATVPAMVGANLAGRVARGFGGKKLEESKINLQQYIDSPDWEGTDADNGISLREYGLLINTNDTDGDTYQVLFNDGRIEEYSINDLIASMDSYGKRNEFCETCDIKPEELENVAHDYPAYFFLMYKQYFGL